MNLSQLKPNERAVITACQEEILPLKLMEMGCVEGVEISFIYRAPLGTPLYYKIGDTRIALGKEIVLKIEVELIHESHAK